MATSNTTNQDNKIVNSENGIVAAPASTLVLPGGSNVAGNKGTLTYSTTNNSQNSQFTPEVKEALSEALQLVGGMSSGVISSQADLTALTKSVVSGLQTITSDTKQAEMPNYTKYVPYAILGVIALVAIMIFKR